MKYCFSLLLLLVAACDMPMCRNTNPVFDTSAPNSPVYNAELARLLRASAGHLRYWVNDYAILGYDTFLILDVQGKGLCAKIWLNVNKPGDGMLDMLKARRAIAYRGAELEGLKYRIVKDADNYRFVYRGLENISD